MHSESYASWRGTCRPKLRVVLPILIAVQMVYLYTGMRVFPGSNGDYPRNKQEQRTVNNILHHHHQKPHDVLNQQRRAAFHRKDTQTTAKKAPKKNLEQKLEKRNVKNKVATVPKAVNQFIVDNVTAKPAVTPTETIATGTIAKTTTTTTTATTMADKKKKEKGQSELSTLERYNEALKVTTVPDPTLKTLGFEQRTFYSGYRNEAMAFTSFVMYAKANNVSQIYLPGLRWKDLFGSNRPVNHDMLFDVVHWNTYYPALPRFVTYHASFANVHPKNNNWICPDSCWNATKPYIFGHQMRLINKYREYTKQVLDRGEDRNPVEILMLQGALRPHPLIEERIAALHQTKFGVGGQGGQRQTYMSLHARVEPDMQKHNFCADKKVRELSTVLNQVTSYLEPPSQVIIALARDLLEAEGLNVTESNNTLAGENLQLLNKIRAEGMWNGTVPVHEAGSTGLADIPYYRHALSIGGAILNFFIAVEADVFIGTPVSSYSTDVIATRFYRNLTENYFYTPDGLQRAYDPVKDRAPPRFGC